MTQRNGFRFLYVLLPCGILLFLSFHAPAFATGTGELDINALVPGCGNEVIEPGEECDGADLGGATCRSLGFAGGGLACTSTCEFDTSACFLVAAPGKAPVTGAMRPVAMVRMEGKAFPGSALVFLRDGAPVSTAAADSQGNFRAEMADVEPGGYTFGLFAVDSQGRQSRTVTFALDVAEYTVTTVSGIILPPTIELSRRRAEPGVPLTLQGQAFAQSTIEILLLPAETREQVLADQRGRWSWPVPTGQLPPGAYTVFAKSITLAGEESPMSQPRGFTILPTPVRELDPEPEPDRVPDDIVEEPVDEPEDIPIDDIIDIDVDPAPPPEDPERRVVGLPLSALGVLLMLGGLTFLAASVLLWRRRRPLTVVLAALGLALLLAGALLAQV